MEKSQKIFVRYASGKVGTGMDKICGDTCRHYKKVLVGQHAGKLCCSAPVPFSQSKIDEEPRLINPVDIADDCPCWSNPSVPPEHKTDGDYSDGFNDGVLYAIKSPAHPAITKEVRKLLLRKLDTTNSVNSEPMAPILRARACLAQCPPETDKAVCPECGHGFDPSDEDNRYCEGPVGCPECGYEFDIEVEIIVKSPPREPKETP